MEHLGQSEAVEVTTVGKHSPLGSSPHIKSKTDAIVDDTDVKLQQIQLDEDEVGDDGLQIDVEEEARHATFYPSIQKGTLPKRIEKARKRLWQHVAYTALMEERMVDMEKRLKGLETKAGDISSAGEPDSEGRKKKKRIYVAILGISRMSFDECKPKPQELEVYKASSYKEQHHGIISMATPPQRRLIEVVVDSLGAGNDFQTDTTDKAEAAHTDVAIGDSSLDETYHTIPERIRINSPLLLEYLQDITGQKFTYADVANEMQLNFQVMLRPFKFLSTYEQDIRQHTHKLEERLTPLQEDCSTKTSTEEAIKMPCESADTRESAKASADRTSELKDPNNMQCSHIIPSNVHPMEGKNDTGMNRAKTGASMQYQADMKEGGDKEDEEDYEKLAELLEELVCLVELLDHDLRPVFDLRRSIQVGSVREIAFADLWHLFRIGDEIRSSDGHSQIYRIIAVFGGRPSLCTKAQASPAIVYDMDKEIDESATLKTNSFCYGFDGTQLGPVQRIFEIKKYAGIKPITSLSVYPVKFSGVGNNDITREGFIDRGQKFIALTQNKAAVVHKRYNGLTLNLEQLREEVGAH